MGLDRDARHTASVLPAAEPNFSSALDEVGLELWHAPEGFVAIRLEARPLPRTPTPRSSTEACPMIPEPSSRASSTTSTSWR